MGTWGVGVFSNDAASDLREDFRELIVEGLTPELATARLSREYGVGRGDKEWDDDFWLALAATQHRLGRIGPGVIERALAICDDPTEAERWSPKDQKRRAQTLAKLKATLAQPPPEPRRVRPRRKVDTLLSVGQHVVMPGVDGRAGLLLRVVGIEEDAGGRCPLAIALEWDGTEVSAGRAHRLPAWFLPSALGGAGAFVGFWLIGEPVDHPALRVLPVVTDADTPDSAWRPVVVSRWSDIEKKLANFYSFSFKD